MGPAVRLIRIFQIATLASVLFYALLGEMLGRKQASETTPFYAFSFVAIAIVGAIVVVRRTLVKPSEDLLRQKPMDNLTLARWRSGYFLMYAMCEALALLGLILRLRGFSLAHIWGYYLGGFVLALLFSPRVARSEFG
jgi:hypothetical protein